MVGRSSASLTLQPDTCILRPVGANIPRTTPYTWKKNECRNFIGSEYATDINQNIQDFQIIRDQRLVFERKIFFAIVRFKIMVLDIFGKEKFRETLRMNKSKFVHGLERIRGQFNQINTISRLSNVSERCYSSWKGIVARSCPSSVISLCYRKHANQTSYAEVGMIRKYMTNPNLLHWPMNAIWALAFKNGHVLIARSTWYNLCRKLDLSKTRRRFKHREKKISVRAPRPNHTWHADVSIYKTIDHVKFYIYTVVDNFSCKIIDWKVSQQLSAKLRVESFKHAVMNEFGIQISDSPHLDLIVDGGSENNNKTVNQFIKECKVNIDKKIALRDVNFSNSSAEAPFKIMKHKYFYLKKIHSSNMSNEMELFVHDYNDERAHYRHGLYTPSQVHDEFKYEDIQQKMAHAKNKRIADNKKFSSCLNRCH